MRKSKKFISLPIISLEEGQKIGVIKEIIIDPNRKEIAAILVEQRGWFKEQKIIPYNKVRSAGTDAITIEKSNSVDKAANFPEIMTFLKDKITLINARVITETGATLGQVDEFWVDEVTGKIIALEVSGKMINSLLKGAGQLSMEYIRTVGKEVLVAAENAEAHLVNAEGGLQDKLKTIKDVTGQLFTNTWQKTRELSKHVTTEKLKGNAAPPSPEPPEDSAFKAADEPATPVERHTPIETEELTETLDLVNEDETVETMQTQADPPETAEEDLVNLEVQEDLTEAQVENPEDQKGK